MGKYAFVILSNPEDLSEAIRASRTMPRYTDSTEQSNLLSSLATSSSTATDLRNIHKKSSNQKIKTTHDKKGQGLFHCHHGL